MSCPYLPNSISFFIPYAQNSGSQLGGILSSRGRLAMARVISDFPAGDEGWAVDTAFGIQWVEAKDAAKHPAMDRTVFCCGDNKRVLHFMVQSVNREEPWSTTLRHAPESPSGGLLSSSTPQF